MAMNGKINFHFISIMLENSNNKKKFKFSQDEDIKLIKLVGIYGDDWMTISKNLKGRNIRQCRERWRYYLDPSLKSVPWTDNDDQLLLQKVHEIGHKWKLLTSYFPGRTYISLKNRYATLTRRISKQKESNETVNTDKLSKQSQNDSLNVVEGIFPDYLQYELAVDPFFELLFE